MREDDERYYRHRAEVEAALAERAEHPQAIAAHHQLATLYADKFGRGEQPRSARYIWQDDGRVPRLSFRN